jgi:large subunit ribosomal protein L5
MVQKNVVEVGEEKAPEAAKPAPKAAPAARPAPSQAKPPASKPPTPKPSAPKPAEGGLRALKVAKVTVNIGVGQAGDRLEKAEKVLGALTNRKPVRTTARDSHRDWAVREGQPIGVKVTLRGPDAIEFAKRALWTRNSRVTEWSFDKEGNLNFGVPDHTQFENQKYNPEIGVFGMDVAVTVERPGFRVKHRRLQPRRLPPDHRVGREESKAFLQDVLGLEIV